MVSSYPRLSYSQALGGRSLLPPGSGVISHTLSPTVFFEPRGVIGKHGTLGKPAHFSHARGEPGTSSSLPLPRPSRTFRSRHLGSSRFSHALRASLPLDFSPSDPVFSHTLDVDSPVTGELADFLRLERDGRPPRFSSALDSIADTRSRSSVPWLHSSARSVRISAHIISRSWLSLFLRAGFLFSAAPALSQALVDVISLSLSPLSQARSSCCVLHHSQCRLTTSRRSRLSAWLYQQPGRQHCTPHRHQARRCLMLACPTLPPAASGTSGMGVRSVVRRPRVLGF